MWSPKKCEQARQAHKAMLSDSRYAHWNYGPELMDLVADMLQACGEDVEEDEFYTKIDQFKPDGEAIKSFGIFYEDDFLNLIPTCESA
jgi:hypothetical protein